jgi:peptidoglycan/LPS O-acetylase OafA/YrhL
MTNTYFVYPFNDVYHFLLNMLFASSWGFANGFSFNGPIWSVSVEMLLYGIFFVFCRMFCRNIIALFVAVILAHFFVVKVNVVIASGLECFFLGGITQVIYENIVKRGDVRKVLTWLPFSAIFAWMVTIEVVNPEHDFSLGGANWIIQKIVSIWAVFVLFPVTIMSLALLETKRGSLGKRFSFVGDISYSSYLIHFPLQLTMATLITKTSYSQTLYYSPWFMISFFFALILVSLASYHYFEIPIQRILRLRTNLTFAKVSI